MFSAFQDSFRWINEIVAEVFSGLGRRRGGKTARYFWRPSVDMRNGRTVCALMTFSAN